MNTVSARSDGLRETAGQGWLEAPLFRIGVSSLLSGLLMQRASSSPAPAPAPAVSPWAEASHYRLGVIGSPPLTVSMGWLNFWVVAGRPRGSTATALPPGIAEAPT